MIRFYSLLALILVFSYTELHSQDSGCKEAKAHAVTLQNGLGGECTPFPDIGSALKAAGKQGLAHPRIILNRKGHFYKARVRVVPYPQLDSLWLGSEYSVYTDRPVITGDGDSSAVNLFSETSEKVRVTLKNLRIQKGNAATPLYVVQADLEGLVKTPVSAMLDRGLSVSLDHFIQRYDSSTIRGTLRREGSGLRISNAIVFLDSVALEDNNGHAGKGSEDDEEMYYGGGMFIENSIVESRALRLKGNRANQGGAFCIENSTVDLDLTWVCGNGILDHSGNGKRDQYGSIGLLTNGSTVTLRGGALWNNGRFPEHESVQAKEDSCASSHIQNYDGYFEVRNSDLTLIQCSIGTENPLGVPAGDPLPYKMNRNGTGMVQLERCLLWSPDEIFVCKSDQEKSGYAATESVGNADGGFQQQSEPLAIVSVKLAKNKGVVSYTPPSGSPIKPAKPIGATFKISAN